MKRDWRAEQISVWKSRWGQQLAAQEDYGKSWEKKPREGEPWIKQQTEQDTMGGQGDQEERKPENGSAEFCWGPNLGFCDSASKNHTELCINLSIHRSDL